MRIVIPSRGRAGRILTLQNKWPAWAISSMEVWVPLNEVKEYRRHAMAGPHPYIVAVDVQGIGHVRQRALAAGGKVLMFDDDLKFFKRRTDDPEKFTDAETVDLTVMLQTLWSALSYVPVAGIACREGGHRETRAFVADTRILRAFGFDCDWLNLRGCRFDRLHVMEDFDLMLQALRAGGHNLSLNMWVQNQAGSNAAGGCSTYRTKAVQAAAAHQLAELHSGLVQAVRRVAKAGLGDRIDARIQWKRSYAGIGQAGVLDPGALQYLTTTARGPAPVVD